MTLKPAIYTSGQLENLKNTSEKEDERVKDKPIVICVTLIAGATACICCIINKAGLFYTLLFTFIALFVFMIIGLIANKLVSGVNNEVKEAEEAEKKRLEEERLEKERLEEEEREREAAETAEAAKSREEAAAAEKEEKKTEHRRLF